MRFIGLKLDTGFSKVNLLEHHDIVLDLFSLFFSPLLIVKGMVLIISVIT